MFSITDNFLDKDSFDALENTSMVYSKVHWIGKTAEPENAFHELVHKIFKHAWRDGSSIISGATAWWNIRPIDPKPHSDLISYCTFDGIDYTPDPPPTTTFLYYLKAPDEGGQLNIYTRPPVPNFHGKVVWKQTETDIIAPIPNRLVSFPIEYIHEVMPYYGNRVSIGVIFWSTLPIIYGETNSNVNSSYDRPWVKKENEEKNKKLTEDYIAAVRQSHGV